MAASVVSSPSSSPPPVPLKGAYASYEDLMSQEPFLGLKVNMAINKEWAGKIKAERGYPSGMRTNCLMGIQSISMLALFIIAAVGTAGLLPGAHLGYAAIGLGGTVLVAQLAIGGEFSKHKSDTVRCVLFTIACVALGVLGITNNLSVVTLGGAILGLNLGGGLLDIVMKKTEIARHYAAIQDAIEAAAKNPAYLDGIRGRTYLGIFCS